MNYYERHIGDYLKDTAHLSLLEHGVYGRLLDVYYTRETPIPAAQVERLIGVRSREERVALQDVLREFFVVDGDVLRHTRCDREIQRYQEKQRKAAASANARWKKGDAHTDGNAKAMRTHSEGNAPSNQTPVTSIQGALVEHQQAGVGFGPDGPARADVSENPGSGSGSDAGPLAAAEAMRAVGLSDVSATHPKLLALLVAGLTRDELVDAARAAVDGGKGFPWALACAEGRRRDAAVVGALPSRAPALDPDSAGAIKADARRLGLGEWQQIDDATGRTIPWSEFAAKVRAARAAERGEVAA